MRKIALVGIMALGGFLTANAQCKTISTLTENFDTWKEINKCWTAQQGKAILYASDKKIREKICIWSLQKLKQENIH
jgi:hypothetical protein